MTQKKPSARSAADVMFDMIGAIVPSCGPALRLAELGQARPLSLRERFVLLYNSPLCPHCRCNREKFNEARSKLRAAQAARSAG